MAKNVIFVTGRGGRLGNQLNDYSFLLAHKLEYPEFNTVMLPILPYTQEYDRTDLSLIDYTNINNSFFRKLLSTVYPQNTPRVNAKNPYFYKLLNKIGPQAIHKIAVAREDAQSLVTSDLPGKNYKKIDLNNETQVLRNKSVSVISGHIKSPTKLISRHRTQIRDQLQPGPKYKQRVESFIRSLRKEYDCLIGIHMRQGDYKTWRGGRYYLSSKEYLELIRKYEQGYPSRSIGFIIASNESQDSKLFNQSNYYTALGESQIKHYIEDFIKLMNCDMILGPPSTFSQWASFLGDIPVVPLYKDSDDSRFNIITSPLTTDLYK